MTPPSTAKPIPASAGWLAGGHMEAPVPAPQSSRCCSSQVDVGMAL